MAGLDPYKAEMFKKNPYALKVPIEGELVVVLDGKLEGRGLELMTPISRALRKNEIHELIITDENEAGPGQTVNRIAYLGFFEVTRGGVMVAGDTLQVGDLVIGTIAGFDETHMPNHLNIVVKSEVRESGLTQGAQLRDRVVCAKTGA